MVSPLKSRLMRLACQMTTGALELAKSNRPSYRKRASDAGTICVVSANNCIAGHAVKTKARNRRLAIKATRVMPKNSSMPVNT